MKSINNIILIFKERVAEFYILLIICGISGYYFSFVGEDYTIFSFNAAAGQFSNYPYFDYYYNGFIGLCEVYKIIYNNIPAYNWVAISFILFGFAALFLSLRIIKKLTSGNVNTILVIRIVQIFFTIFFIENIFVLSHTRFSLVFCGVGLIGLLFTPNISRNEFISYFILFSLGLFIRPEGSFGTIILVAGLYLISEFNPKYLAKRFALPTVISCILFGFIFLDWYYTDTYVKRVEPEIEYKMAARRIVPLSTMKTDVDSIKYELSRRGMWFDYKTLTPEYLRSLQISTLNLNPEQTKNDWHLSRLQSSNVMFCMKLQHLADVYFHLITFYYDYPFIICTYFILFLLSIYKIEHRKWAYKVFAFGLYTFIILYAIDYNGFLVSDRHFLGIQQVSLLFILTYFLKRVSIFHNNKWVLIGCFLLLSIETLISLIRSKERNNITYNNIIAHEKSMKKLEERYQNKIIVLTVSNYNLFDRRISLKNNNYLKNKYIMFDLFTYSLTPNYLSYLKSECLCDPSNPVGFFQWLSNENALYISNSLRFNLTEKYMNIVHRQNLKFVKTDTKIIDHEKNELTNDFEIRNVLVEAN